MSAQKRARIEVEPESESPVVLQDHKMPAVLQKEFEDDCKKRGYVIRWRQHATSEELQRTCAVFSYLHDPVNDKLLDQIPNVKVVSNFGAGYDHVDVEACGKRKIPCGHTPGAVNKATADVGMGLLLAAARNIVEGDRRSRQSLYDANWFGVEVSSGHAVLGIVGMGNIGLEVAKRAFHGFDMKICYHNRKAVNPARLKPYAIPPESVEFCSLAELLRKSDFVMLCCSLNPSTTNLIGYKELCLMQPSATLINIARGKVVNQPGLIRALKEGKIRAAALDVFEPEPLPKGHPLISDKALVSEKLILTPHVGSATLFTRRKMLHLAMSNMYAGLSGKPLPHPAL